MASRVIISLLGSWARSLIPVAVRELTGPKPYITLNKCIWWIYDTTAPKYYTVVWFHLLRYSASSPICPQMWSFSGYFSFVCLTLPMFWAPYDHLTFLLNVSISHLALFFVFSFWWKGEASAVCCAGGNPRRHCEPPSSLWRGICLRQGEITAQRSQEQVMYGSLTALWQWQTKIHVQQWGGYNIPTIHILSLRTF